MNIYVDFDHTLFNTTLFIKEIKKLTKEDFRKPNVKELEKVIKENNIDLKKYLYPDTLLFLEKYSSNNLILLTRGNLDYQLFKIKESKIENYFKNIIVVNQYKGLLNLDYKNSIFIDDNPKEIESILKNNPKKVIRLKRGKYKDILLSNPTIEYESLLDINL